MYDVEKTFNELMKTHQVDGFVADHTQHVFVLESPHIEEIKHGMPVSGSSGKSMSSVLFNNRMLLPLGRLVKKNQTENMGDVLLDKIGLMNVCNIPMQKSAYEDPEVVSLRGKVDTVKYEDFFRFLERVRTNQTALYATPECNKLQEIILADFKKRMEPFVGRKLTFIPCGKFANKFFRMLDLDMSSWTVVYDVPHPSYNNWEKPIYAERIKHMKQILGDASDNN